MKNKWGICIYEIDSINYNICQECTQIKFIYKKKKRKEKSLLMVLAKIFSL